MSSMTDENFIKTYELEIENIPSQIKIMLEERGIDFLIVDYIHDLFDAERLNKHNEIYKDDIVKKSTARGVLSDDNYCIAISIKNTKIEHIGAILYHELGHFLDAYDNFGQVDELGLSLSSDEKFIEAYSKDFKNHYEKIKNDTNLSLIHFVQKSTPENINQIGIIETFAELFRVASNKENSTKTVELYFPTALRVFAELVNKRFDLRLELT